MNKPPEPSLNPPIPDRIARFWKLNKLWEPNSPNRPASLAGKRLIVVGGGFAGLAAAWYAKQVDAKVTLLEANERVGGRVETETKDGRHIERGAELIGAIHPLWLYFFERLSGLNREPISDDEVYKREKQDVVLRIANFNLNDPKNGNLRDDVEMIERIVYDKMNEDAKRCFPPDKPWSFDHQYMTLGSILKATVSAALSNPDLKLKSADRQKVQEISLAYLEAIFANNNGKPTDDQSYAANLALVAGGMLYSDNPNAFWEEDELYRCKQGNRKLADVLADAVGTNNVKLKAVVTELTVGEDGIKIIVNNGTASYEADYVILAVPPTVLGGIKFVGAPASLTDAVQRARTIQTANLVKAFIPMDAAFWSKLSNLKLAPTGTADEIGMFWEGTDNQQVKEDHRILSVFAGAAAARKAMDHNKEKTLNAYYDGLFQKIYGDAWQRLEHTNVMFESWPENEHIMIGYSCPKVGDLQNMHLLSTPLANRITFAGEHTSVPFWGFMEGALESGVLAVDRLIRVAIPSKL